MIAGGKSNGMIVRGITIMMKIVHMLKIVVIFVIYIFQKLLSMTKSDH